MVLIKKSSSVFRGITMLLAVMFVLSIANPAFASELSQNQKEDYYKQYVQIVDEVVADHPGAELEVVPFNEFKDTDWIAPEEFKQMAIDRANAKVEVVENSGITPRVSATKSASINSNGASASISVKGDFNTIYDEARDRQVFGTINSITSSTSSSGTWTQSGYTQQRIDGGRTYSITVGGKYKVNGLSSTHNVTVEFNCSATGAVS